MITDDQGFEIPEDMELVTDEEVLHSLPYAEKKEYERLKIKSPIKAEIYKANCIQERLKQYLKKKENTAHLYELNWEQWNEYRRIRYEKGERAAEQYKNDIILSNLKKWQKQNG